MARRILVWDLPTRAFHWLLAISFTGAFLTTESERWRDVHVMLGYTALGLIAFRVLWGLAGTRYARFAAFAFGPRRVLGYLGSIVRDAPEHHLGHNPAGSWAIYALLALGIAAGATGYLAFNDFGGEWLAEAHEAMANAMLAVVMVHIAGVAVSSLLHRENLVRAMLDGRKRGEPRQAISGPRTAIGIALVAAVITFWVDQATNPMAPPSAERIAMHRNPH